MHDQRPVTFPATYVAGTCGAGSRPPPFASHLRASRALRGCSEDLGDELADTLRVDAGVLAEGPADGLVDKELLRAQVLADDGPHQGKIGFLLVVELKEDAGAAEPEVIGPAPFGEIAGLHLGITLEVQAHGADGDRIDRVPP